MESKRSGICGGKSKTDIWSDRMKVVKPTAEETSRKNIIRKNQSVENSGVAFVKVANERNEFFEKIDQH